ncbi:hypothetical protein F5B21DRAFT_505387 [Xylaria acuta]|nr:hypothetical protein F5B21DRAFT_505387 [Xylaria acuta]
MSPETPSTLFPDRPIRPLPKRRLRERIPPDVADSIKYPPAPQASTPLFVYPYNSREESSSLSTDLVGAASRDNGLKPERDAGFRRNGLVTNRDDDSLMTQARRALGSRGFHEPAEHGIRAPPRSGQPRHPKPQPPPSTASSADGYDSFENTNNKKKRKIPIAGETILNGTHVLNEPAAFGMPSPPATGDDDSGDHVPTSTPYYQSGGPLSNGQGISGPGRGRYGRIRNGRSPLRALSDSNANWTGRNMKLRTTSQYPSPPAEHPGIISTAIASAEKIPVPTGQENISLLQQQIPTKPSPRSSTQFTFTFGSQNPVSWPGSDPASQGMAGSHRAHQPSDATDYHHGVARSTQTQPGLSSTPVGQSGTQTNVHPSGDGSGKRALNAAATAKKPKRRGNSLLQAARQRRRETEYQNMHHPPAPEDYYLCEFCEYELIFGHPPEALIRQYEIKDRRRRREEAERRRLLEKAKMKSRKGKKVNSNKVPARNNSAADRTTVAPNDVQHQPAIDHPHDHDDGEDIRSEAFDSEDNYDDHLSHGELPALIPDIAAANNVFNAQPFSSATANPNATTAAASAFMSAANQNPNKALSSAAAAAALRARPHTPTNVAEVQTKRTLRRSASVSSSGSAPVSARLPNGHGQLQRRGSTASMTERTFRSPSPHRSSTPAATEQQPPVPRIPDSHKSSTTSPRTTGVGMQNFRTASQKMASEPPSWYVQPAGDVSNVRRSDSIMRATKSPPPALPNIIPSQPGRPESRGSVNFSYPTSFRPQSPPASPTLSSMSHMKVSSPHPPTSAPDSSSRPSNGQTRDSQQLVYDPNSRRMVPKAQVEEAVEYEIRQIADKPSRRRRDGALRREGSQLAKGTVARAKGTIVDENKRLRKLPSREQPVVEVLQAAEEKPAGQEHGAKAVATTDSVIDPDTATQSPKPRESKSKDLSSSMHNMSSERGRHFRPGHQVQDPAAVVQDKPTLNDEEPKMEDHSKVSQAVMDALDAIPTRQALFEGPHPSQPNRKLDAHEGAQDSHPPATVGKPGLSEVSSEQKALIAENKPVVVLAAEGSGLRRSNSESPARQARFAPVPAEKLAVRHAPLPRSASPIKSAMKHSSPVPQETPPSDNLSDPSGSGAVSPDQKEEPAVSRKKSVRVSFDDHGPVIAGDSISAAEVDSMSGQSPQGHMRAWFSNIGRSKKKEIALDDDEIMKPRPALPSFGSIREKKKRELEERPLVRPLEPAQSLAISSSPELRPHSSSTLDDSETTEEPMLGQSSDHAVGALLAQDQSSRIAANISRFREPLPPVVTSIEGSGYSSDSSQGSEYEEQPGNTTETGMSTVSPSMLSMQLTQPDIDDTTQNASTTVDIPHNEEANKPVPMSAQQQDIPQISVIQPSPMPSEHGPHANGSSNAHCFDVPGGFPDCESDFSGDSQLKNAKDNKSSPSSVAIFEPNIATVEPSQAEILPQTTLQTMTNLKGPDDTTGDESDESIYSDAYEDIPDFDSSGFMSLDAVVESPTREQLKPNLIQISQSSPMRIVTEETERDVTSADHSASLAQLSPSQDTSDWEQAKAFWRSLTAEKRRQLELEAAEEAAADGDREDVSQPVRRSSTRKKSPELQQPTKQIPAAQGKIAQTEPRMRISLRNEQTTRPTNTQPQTGMRRTLRSNGGAPSVSKPSTRQAAASKTPTATSAVSTQNRATNPRPHSSTLSASRNQVTTQVKPSLQRRGSDASDSSFKRSRHLPSGTLAFRKTMRETSPIQPHHEPTRGSGRFSLRSLSPVASTVRRESDTSFAAPSPAGMKRTLRSNSESSHDGKRSSIHFPLFMRSTKSPPRGSKWTSRFEDSSDEEGASAGFRSRIQDSSDEEESRPSPLKETKSQGKAALRSSATAPILSRPAPVPEVEEDSPELPDSDDDFMPSPLQTPQRRITNGNFASHLEAARPKSGAIGTSTLGRSRSGRGGLPPSFTSPELSKQDKRGSLLSILRRNKRAGQVGKIQRSGLVDSAARRDTKLERDSGQLKDLRSEQHSSPKLQKKSFISQSGGGVLQRPTSAGNLLGRSATADAIERVNLGGRRSVSLGLNPNNESHDLENASVESSGYPKKKKFGALRRMFKLDE